MSGKLYQKFSKIVPEGYEYPKVSDFKFSLVAGLIITGIQICSEKLLYPVFKNICKDQHLPVKNRLRIRKAT